MSHTREISKHQYFEYADEFGFIHRVPGELRTPHEHHGEITGKAETVPNRLKRILSIISTTKKPGTSQ